MLYTKQDRAHFMLVLNTGNAEQFHSRLFSSQIPALFLFYCNWTSQELCARELGGQKWFNVQTDCLRTALE